ncbi:MAG: sensor histidine kinase [Defluviicoccus sp.]|nr:MAG: sensor histidine kinase [Defluviicoccus sp.]
MSRSRFVTMVPLASWSARIAAAAQADRLISTNLAVLADVLHRYSAEIATRAPMTNVRDISVLMGGIAARIELLGRLHRELADRGQQQGGSIGQINLSDSLSVLCEDLANTLPPPGRIVLSHRLARDCMVPADQALPLALITCEVVSNAIRHAHPADVVGFVNVCCWRDPSEGLLLDIADDGIGLPPGFDPATDSGFGLRLVHELSQQLGGTCVFDDSGLGLHFRLRIPRSAGARPCPGEPSAVGAGRHARS